MCSRGLRRAHALVSFDDRSVPVHDLVGQQFLLLAGVGGPERVIDMIEERAPEGFERLTDVASHEELEAVVKGYSKMAGFDRVKAR